MGALIQTGSDRSLDGSVFPCEVDISLDAQKVMAVEALSWDRRRPRRHGCRLMRGTLDMVVNR